MNIFNWIINRNIFTYKTKGDFCLSKEEAAEIRNLDYKKLMEMESKDRLSVITKILGEEKAEWFNGRFDKDLVLKHQKDGLMKWAKEMDMKPDVRKEIINKILKLERSLNQKELEEFIEKMTKLALGLCVSEKDAKPLFDLGKKVNDAKAKMENGGSRADYEKAFRVYEDYVRKLRKAYGVSD